MRMTCLWMSQPINIPGFAQLVERLTAELDCQDRRTNTQGLKNLRNEDTVYAMQTARPSPGSDDHVNGGSVSSRRRKNSVPNLNFRAKYIDARTKYFFPFLFFVGFPQAGSNHLRVLWIHSWKCLVHIFARLKNYQCNSTQTSPNFYLNQDQSSKPLPFMFYQWLWKWSLQRAPQRNL